MKSIEIHTSVKKMPGDIYTPVGIYLRLRDRFRDTILLESTDHHAGEDSYSFICINAIAGIEIKNSNEIEVKYPGLLPSGIDLKLPLHERLWEFMNRFRFHAQDKLPARFAQGLYGYFSYDIVPLIEKHSLKKQIDQIPIARYRLYQYVIAINHYKDELILCENKTNGIRSELPLVEALVNNKNVPVYPFSSEGRRESNFTDEEYLQVVDKGIKACYRGDVFQVVLSRRFTQAFHGDEFNVYRALRSINPSPYLFYFDYGDYKLMGSSPEAQLLIRDGIAIVHPIAGTYKRTGDDSTDRQKAVELENDPKENAEHVMLVDLARNDLSMVCENVEVSSFKLVKYYSHVIHLVSEVRGSLKEGFNPFRVLFKTFPAGTLSGAPKYRAMQLLHEWEPVSRGFYGGAIGFIGYNGDCTHAIMIRSILSQHNTITMQAGAGIVAHSDPETELQEVNNKLNALSEAINKAGSFNKI